MPDTLADLTRAELEQRVRELERLTLAMAEKIYTLANHLSMLAERKEQRKV